MMSIATTFPYFADLSVTIVAEPGFIIQYDTVQASCNTLV